LCLWLSKTGEETSKRLQTKDPISGLDRRALVENHAVSMAAARSPFILVLKPTGICCTKTFVVVNNPSLCKGDVPFQRG